MKPRAFLRLTLPEILRLADDDPDSRKRPPPGSTPLLSEAHAQEYRRRLSSRTLKDRIAEAKCRL